MTIILERRGRTHPRKGRMTWAHDWSSIHYAQGSEGVEVFLRGGIRERGWVSECMLYLLCVLPLEEGRRGGEWNEEKAWLCSCFLFLLVNM